MIRCKNAWGSLLWAAVLAGSLATPDSLQAGTFSLEYRTNGPSAEFRLPLEKTEVRFQKEPEYVGEQVVRGVLSVGPGKKEYIGFACDQEGKKLYLDLNRNLDLTDDPDGIHASAAADWGHSFENVAIPIEQGGRRRDLVVDLTIYGESYGRYSVKSSWENEAVAIGDGLWRVSVVDNGDGVIDREDSLYLEPVEKNRKKTDAEARVDVQAPTSLTLDGAQFEFSYELSGDGKTLALSIEPGEEKLLDVELAGEGIERLVLQDRKSAAVFIHPSSAIRLPEGRYRANVRVCTGEGKNALQWEAVNVSFQRQDGQDPEPWVVGGPIVSKLTCKKEGNRLVFNQAATGAGGETYSLASSSGGALGKPKLRVKKDGKVIHVGNFEYG